MILAELQPAARIGLAITKESARGEAALRAALAILADDLPPQRSSASGAYAPGEHPYLAITASASTYDEAIEIWADRFVTFLAENEGDVLWWRTRPAISGEVDCATAEPVWTVYAKAAIGAAE